MNLVLNMLGNFVPMLYISNVNIIHVYVFLSQLLMSTT